MKKFPLLAMSFGVIVSAQVMAADNAVNYSGSICDATDGGMPALLLKKQYQGLHNSSSAAINISCPIVMDEVLNTTGTNSILFFASARMSCWFHSANGDGTTKQLNVGTGGPGWVSIPNITSDDVFGSYMMACTLPAGAALRTISVSEKP